MDHADQSLLDGKVQRTFIDSESKNSPFDFVSPILQLLEEQLIVMALHMRMHVLLSPEGLELVHVDHELVPLKFSHNVVILVGDITDKAEARREMLAYRLNQESLVEYQADAFVLIRILRPHASSGQAAIEYVLRMVSRQRSAIP